MKLLTVASIMFATLTFGLIANANETCFRADNIYDFRSTGNRKLEVRTRGNAIFEVQTGMCMYLHRAWYLDFRTRQMNYVCKSDQMFLFDSHGRQIEQCRITSVTLKN